MFDAHDAYEAACFDAADDTDYNTVVMPVQAAFVSRAYMYDANVHFACEACGAPRNYRCANACKADQLF